jgi:hypothetical protein
LKAVAIDPGGTTGWAVFNIDYDKETSSPLWKPRVAYHFEDAGQLTRGQHHDELYTFLALERPDYLIYERFEKRNNDFALLISCEYIGVCKAFAQRCKIPIFAQGASDVFNFCSDDKMEYLDLFLRPLSRWKDANAARRHLLYWLVNQQNRPKIRSHLLQTLR